MKHRCESFWKRGKRCPTHPRRGPEGLKEQGNRLNRYDGPRPGEMNSPKRRRSGSLVPVIRRIQRAYGTMKRSTAQGLKRGQSSRNNYRRPATRPVQRPMPWRKQSTTSRAYRGGRGGFLKPAGLGVAEIYGGVRTVRKVRLVKKKRPWDSGVSSGFSGRTYGNHYPW